jgi:hypothetical protein
VTTTGFIAAVKDRPICPSRASRAQALLQALGERFIDLQGDSTVGHGPIIRPSPFVVNAAGRYDAP